MNLGDIIAEVQPLERSEDQGLLLLHMAQLNQHLLSPWVNADGEMMPRLTLTEGVATFTTPAELAKIYADAAAEQEKAKKSF